MGSPYNEMEKIIEFRIVNLHKIRRVLIITTRQPYDLSFQSTQVVHVIFIDKHHDLHFTVKSKRQKLKILFNLRVSVRI